MIVLIEPQVHQRAPARCQPAYRPAEWHTPSGQMEHPRLVGLVGAQHHDMS
jgi:hypothetical protein